MDIVDSLLGQSSNPNRVSDFGYQLSQGKAYLNFSEEKQQQLANNLKLIENFTGARQRYKSVLKPTVTSVKSAQEYQELLQLQKKFNEKLSGYSRSHQVLMTDSNTFLDSSDKSDQYINQNLRTATGDVSYVTNKGFYKSYPSESIQSNTMGQNGCPSNIKDVSIDDLSLTTPPLNKGTDMSSGQPCGNEGTNLQINLPGLAGAKNYEGCYQSETWANNSNRQEDLGTNVTIATCKQRASDLDMGVFGLGYAKDCYVGNDLSQATAGGISYMLIPKWNSGTGGTGDDNALILTRDGNLSLYKLNPTASGLISSNGDFSSLINSLVSESVLWTSNSAKNGCDPAIAGQINNITASYGLNCNVDSQYNVQKGNMTDEVGNAVSSSNFTNAIYTVGFPEKTEARQYCISTDNDGNCLEYGDKMVTSRVDPAPGCEKLFTASYKCGAAGGANNTETMIEIDPEAYGKLAKFDCGNQMSICGAVQLTLSNNGNLIISTSNSETSSQDVNWSTNLTNTASTYEKIAVENPVWVASGRTSLVSKVGGSVKKSVLSVGEYLVSPNGFFQAVLDETGNFTINMTSMNCSTSGVDEHYPINDGGVAIYTHKLGGNDNIGKSGYITDDGKLKQYPSSMLTTSSEYSKVGDYNTSGTALNSLTSTNVNGLKTACTDYGADCAGFTHDKATNSGTLYNSTMFPKGLRTPASDTELYTRMMGVTNNNSCNKDVVGGTSDIWDKYQRGSQMAMDTPCNLAVAMKQQQQDLTVATNELDIIADKINKKIDRLNSTDIALVESLGQNLKKLKKDVRQYTRNRQNIRSMQNKNVNVTAMLDNADLELISDNYKYILWSILAITIILGGIKASRN